MGDFWWLASQPSSGTCELALNCQKESLPLPLAEGTLDSVGVYLWLHIEAHASLQAPSIPAHKYLFHMKAHVIIFSSTLNFPSFPPSYSFSFSLTLILLLSPDAFYSLSLPTSPPQPILRSLNLALPSLLATPSLLRFLSLSASGCSLCHICNKKLNHSRKPSCRQFLYCATSNTSIFQRRETSVMFP